MSVFACARARICVCEDIGVEPLFYPCMRLGMIRFWVIIFLYFFPPCFFFWSAESGST